MMRLNEFPTEEELRVMIAEVDQVAMKNVTVVDALQHCCYEFPREDELGVMIAEADQVDMENVI
jgi:hypothetical protein